MAIHRRTARRLPLQYVGQRSRNRPTGGNMSETLIYVDENKQIAAQRLWRAVIASTVQEWISGPLRRQREAEQFLFHDDSDYRTVCSQAGIDPGKLRSRLQKIRSRTALEAISRTSKN